MLATMYTSIGRWSATAATVALGSTIRQILSALVRDELAPTVDKNSADVIPREFVQYVVGAYMAVLTWWLDGGVKLPPQRIDAMFRRWRPKASCRRDEQSPTVAAFDDCECRWLFAQQAWVIDECEASLLWVGMAALAFIRFFKIETRV